MKKSFLFILFVLLCSVSSPIYGEQEIYPADPYSRDLQGVSDDAEALHPDVFSEAAKALDSSQPPMSPAAAREYFQGADQKQMLQKMLEGQEGVLADIFSGAEQQGLSKEQIQNFVEANAEPGEYVGKHILVFISSSMPDAMIRNLMATLGNEPNVVFILRGVIGNDVSKIIPTQAWVRQFLCPDDKCYPTVVDINPVLFERLDINRVPAIAYVPQPEIFLPACDGGDAGGEDYLVYYGDLSPLYALEQFQKVRPGDTTLAGIISSVGANKGFYAR